MPSVFKLSIADTDFEVHSINVKAPSLFQIYVVYQGKRMRYHLHLNTDGSFEFALRENVPPAILDFESRLSDGIKGHCDPHNS